MARIERTSLNSVRAVEDYATFPQELLKKVEQTIARLRRWTLIEAGDEGLHAIHETRFFSFRDDVRITVAEIGEESRLECESRSRLGTYDFGQNGRNLRELLAEIERELG